VRRAGASVVGLVRAVVRWGVGQVRGGGTVGVAQRRCRRERHQAASGVGGVDLRYERWRTARECVVV
jgi:hypothetical protein